MKSKCRVILNSFITSNMTMRKMIIVETKTGKLFGILWLEIFRKQKHPPEVFCRKDVPRNVAKFTGKHLFLKPVTLLKKSPWHKCFPINFAKFLRTSFFTERARWLLLLPTSIYLFKINKGNTKKICEIFSKLKIKTSERHQRLHFDVFTVNFEHVPHIDFE